MSEAAVLEAKRKRSQRARICITVIALLATGMFAATWQFHASGNEAGGDAVASWFGEWLVYGILAYVVFRLYPRTPPGFAAVLATIVVVGGVNYKTHTAISTERQMLASLAKATPLINKIQSGMPVSDQEVKDAQVGIMEPLMLAQAAFSRDVIAITASYNRAVADLQPELMLTPRSLASPNIRVQTRAKLKVWQRAASDYKSQLDAATARGKLGIRGAQSQMPATMADSASTGLTNRQPSSAPT